MSEYQPSQPTPERATPQPTLQELGLSSDSPEQLALWNDGLQLWGTVFVAYTRLGRPELHTPEVLLEFQMAHVVTHPDWETAVLTHLADKRWPQRLDAFLIMYNIPNHLVMWDADELERWVRGSYDCVEEGGQLHLFARKAGNLPQLAHERE